MTLACDRCVFTVKKYSLCHKLNQLQHNSNHTKIILWTHGNIIKHSNNDIIVYMYCLPGRGCCVCTCHRLHNLNGQSVPWWCKTWLIFLHLFPDRSIQTWYTLYRRPVAVGAQTEACNPNTGGDSTLPRHGEVTAGQREGGEKSRSDANYRSVGPWFEDTVFQTRINWLLTQLCSKSKQLGCDISLQCVRRGEHCSKTMHMLNLQQHLSSTGLRLKMNFSERIGCPHLMSWSLQMHPCVFL